MGKKDGCAGLGCNNDGLFAEKYTVKDHNIIISNTKRVQWILLKPPGHPIILCKSN